MGEKLVREAVDYVKSPDALTTPERMWLVKQAADADDDTRRCRMTAEDYGFDEMLARLIAKGALKIREGALIFTEMDLNAAFRAYQAHHATTLRAKVAEALEVLGQAREQDWELATRMLEKIAYGDGEG